MRKVILRAARCSLLEVLKRITEVVAAHRYKTKPFVGPRQIGLGCRCLLEESFGLVHPIGARS